MERAEPGARCGQGGRGEACADDGCDARRGPSNACRWKTRSPNSAAPRRGSSATAALYDVGAARRVGNRPVRRAPPRRGSGAGRGGGGGSGATRGARHRRRRRRRRLSADPRRPGAAKRRRDGRSPPSASCSISSRLRKASGMAADREVGPGGSLARSGRGRRSAAARGARGADEPARRADGRAARRRRRRDLTTRAACRPFRASGVRRRPASAARRHRRRAPPGRRQRPHRRGDRRVLSQAVARPASSATKRWSPLTCSRASTFQPLGDRRPALAAVRLRPHRRRGRGRRRRQPRGAGSTIASVVLRAAEEVENACANLVQLEAHARDAASADQGPDARSRRFRRRPTRAG